MSYLCRVISFNDDYNIMSPRTPVALDASESPISVLLLYYRKCVTLLLFLLKPSVIRHVSFTAGCFRGVTGCFLCASHGHCI